MHCFRAVVRAHIRREQQEQQQQRQKGPYFGMEGLEDMHNDTAGLGTPPFGCFRAEAHTLDIFFEVHNKTGGRYICMWRWCGECYRLISDNRLTRE